jgi:hypothetical protein
MHPRFLILLFPVRICGGLGLSIQLRSAGEKESNRYDESSSSHHGATHLLLVLTLAPAKRPKRITIQEGTAEAVP